MSDGSSPAGQAELEPEPVSVDTPPRGLRAFDLGNVPASVTPPKSWRRAAWFAVATSCAVMAALATATVVLAGNPREPHTIDALPSQPTHHLVITDLPATGLASDLATPRRTVTAPEPPMGSTIPRLDPATVNNPVAGLETATLATPTSVTPMLPAAAAASADPLSDLVQRYYSQITEDVVAAADLTTGRAHAEGVRGIQARYPDASNIDVTAVQIDPTRSAVRVELEVLHTDGSTSTTWRTLRVTSGPEPKIAEDTAGW